jgi:hypothetical protein
MSRKLPAAIAVGVFLADVTAIMVSTGFLQTWVDSRLDAPPPWPGLVWLISFFPARFVLRLPPFDHPLGLGGPHDDYVWGGLTLVNALLWGAIAYAVARRYQARRRVAPAI